MGENSVNGNSNGNQDQIFEERRKFIRLNINVQVNYSLLDGKDVKRIATTRDIGAGGIRLFVDGQIKRGDVIKLEFLLPESPPQVFATGRIVWVKPFSIEGDKTTRFDAGIEFLDINPQDRERINKYVFSLKIVK